MAPPSTLVHIAARVLPVEEWSRVADREPFLSHGLPADPGTWRILVVEVDGVIVATSCIFAAAHWDGWEVDPSFRRHASVIRAMLREGKRVLEDEGVGGVFAQIKEDADPDYRQMIERLGLKRAPGDLYLAGIRELLEV